MAQNYYITTPIYYVNDKPHIGHAYTTLACDVLARFKRLDGFDVTFLTGTDEHGQKVEIAAQDKAVSPQSFTDEVSQNFRDLTGQMNFSNDDFIRTTEPRHKLACQEIWRRLQERGHIRLGNYAGWYSVRDEAFFTETEVGIGNNLPDTTQRLVKGLTVEHITNLIQKPVSRGHQLCIDCARLFWQSGHNRITIFENHRARQHDQNGYG